MPLAIFLQIKGIPGNSKDSKHPSWIELTSFDFSVSNSEDTLKEKDEESEGTNLNSITISKKVDKSSVPLANHACERKNLPSFEVHICRPHEDKQFTFLEYILEGAKIEEYSISASESYPTENLTIKYTNIKWTYGPETATGEYSIEEGDSK